jgi:hypothetical protein
MQWHTVTFEGDEVKGEQCLIFKMKADHSAATSNCAFCNDQYSDSLPGRWDVFQCGAVGFGGMVEEYGHIDSACVLFYVCSDCRLGNAVQFIANNLDPSRKIFFENASNKRLYEVDTFSNLNY